MKKKIIFYFSFYLFLLILFCGCEKPITTVEAVSAEIQQTPIAWIEEFEVETIIEDNESPLEREVLQAFTTVIQNVYADYEYLIYVKDNAFYIDIWLTGLADNVSTSIVYNYFGQWNSFVENTQKIVVSLKGIAEALGSDYDVYWTWYDTVKGSKTPFLAFCNDEVYFSMVVEILEKSP